LPSLRLCAPRCSERTPLTRYVFGIWYCGCEVVLPNALSPEILNLGQPALMFGPCGRLGMPSSCVELGYPKFGGKTPAPSLVYPRRASRIVVGVRVTVLPATALCPRVKVLPNWSLLDPSAYPLKGAGRKVVESEKL